MSSSPSIPRPPSRSERLLRDTLRKDDTLRTHSAHTSRPRSSSSNCDDEDDNIFESAILLRRSSRRNSAASALSHGHPTSFYVPDEDEHASYSRLLRSPSHSGSSRSGRSGQRSPPHPAYTQEKQDESSRHHDAAPHEAVLRSRLESVMHSIRIDQHTDAYDALTLVQSSSGSLPSSLGSISNAQANSHESHQTHLTIPDPRPCSPPASRSERSSHRSHRHAQSTSVAHPQPTTPHRKSAPRVTSQSPSPRSSRNQRPAPRTPTSHEKEHLKHHPDSPWMYVPLPPSPPTFSASPSKHGGPAVVAFVASSPMMDAHTHMSSPRHSPHSPSAFDPKAASHALRQSPGYVSFASVAGLGAPPEEEDRGCGRKSISGGFTLGGGAGQISGFGLGGGKWWIF